MLIWFVLREQQDKTILFVVTEHCILTQPVWHNPPRPPLV